MNGLVSRARANDGPFIWRSESGARMADPSFSIGVDFGTGSVRTLVVDNRDGAEVASAVFDYPGGDGGVIGDPRDPNLARQHPTDYLAGLRTAVPAAVRQAGAYPGFRVDRIVGIGVDSTGSTPIPVDGSATPLALQPRFTAEPAALAWLWKDHTAHAEAAEITERAGAAYPYLAKCGGTYSSEWYWSKILRCERASPAVAAAAAGWVELCDYIPAYLTGVTTLSAVRRSVCAAGHKAMYHQDWGGLPSAEFLEGLSPGLSRFRDGFTMPALSADRLAGPLAADVAATLGLPPGIAVAVGAFDAHLGAVGAGAAPGTLVKIIGTSTCDCIVAPLSAPLADIPGVCGIVPESILPGMYGIEAGQSAVGDIFDWFARRIAPAGYGTGAEAHLALGRAAAALRPGESGLMALDWHNGNRTILVDPLLTGLIVGETLQTTPPEIYRALIEATAFGALTIIDRLEAYGVRVDRVVNCGGIAEKNPLVMQIYADVIGRPMVVSRSAQTCALGAAIAGAVAGGAHPTMAAAQQVMTGVKPDGYVPVPAHHAVYRKLYQIYRRLHDAFSRDGNGSVHRVMKELIETRQSVRMGS